MIPVQLFIMRGRGPSRVRPGLKLLHKRHMSSENLRHPQTGEPDDGFRNLAKMLSLDYFRIHIPQAPTPEDPVPEAPEARSEREGLVGGTAVGKRATWHVDDVRVEKGRF